MSERAVMTTWTIGGQTSIYLHQDRVEVGTTDLVFNETLARVAYRDARSCVTWTATRHAHLWLGVAVLLVAGVFGVLAMAALGDGSGAARELLGISTTAWQVFFALGGLTVGAALAYMGRPGGITKFRLDGVRGHVEGVLSGSRRKRDSLLDEIERRIQDRQHVRQS